MTTHTPGPWVWIEGSDAINCRWNNLDWTIASVGNHRLGWHQNKSCEVREASANAKVIASAPELLAELQNIANANPSFWDGPFNDSASFQEWAQSRARAAIAKAVQA